MTYGVVAVYLLVLVVIGWVSSRRGASSAEDYFLASRGFGTLVLFMALFGTNVTAFALLGLPGLAYHKGVAVLGFFGAAAAFWSPVAAQIIVFTMAVVAIRLFPEGLTGSWRWFKRRRR